MAKSEGNKHEAEDAAEKPQATKVKGKSSFEEISKSGEYQRSASVFRDHITAEGGKFPAAAGRYLLVISYACPWASRCMAVRALKGLEKVIEVAVVRPKWDSIAEGTDLRGWVFQTADYPDCYPGATVDPIFGVRTLADFYVHVDPEHTTKYSVPVLFCKETKQIVNNESSEIIRMFNSEFNAYADNPALDLWPADLKEAQDAVYQWIYDDINNGVYKTGFATTQTAYERNLEKLFAGLDRAERILDGQRFIAGDRFTGSDIQLCVTLWRFDAVYHTHFKCNRKLIREYPNLRNYARDVYQQHGGKLAPTVKMDHIKDHYYGSHIKINPYLIVPPGPAFDFNEPHDRDRFAK